jgi:tetratricopeptide (TPR) repeat protein
MTAERFDRYRDALRKGHVAALRDRHGEAIDAYEEAAELAPERALPHASIGRILVKLNRPNEALAAFGRALDRAPADETALAGRGEVLVALDRRVEAAESFVRLAEAQAAAGRLAEATDAARQALELAESRPGRSFLERMVDQLRAEDGDTAAAAAISRAMLILEPPTPPEPEALDAAAAQDRADASAEPEPRAADAAADVPVEPDEPPQTPPEHLLDEAESLAAAGRSGEARERYLAAASAYREERRLDAAVDACLTVLRFDPADPAVHLLLADLYLDHGWQPAAAAKLDLLRRLATLTGDSETEQLAEATVVARLGGVAGTVPGTLTEPAAVGSSHEVASPG